MATKMKLVKATHRDGVQVRVGDEVKTLGWRELRHAADNRDPQLKDIYDSLYTAARNRVIEGAEWSILFYVPTSAPYEARSIDAFDYHVFGEFSRVPDPKRAADEGLSQPTRALALAEAEERAARHKNSSVVDRD